MMEATPETAPYSSAGSDRVLHEKARLGIMTSLMSHPKGLAFSDLRQLCGLTDGNLSRHLLVLEEAKVVEIVKSFQHKRPLTTCRLTASGRRRFIAYIEVLEQVVRDAARVSHEASAGARPRPA